MNQRILVIRFSSLGDILLTSPTVLNIRLAFPHAQLTYLTKEAYGDIVRRFDGVDEIITLPKGESTAGYLSMLLKHHHEHFTHVFDLHANARSWLANRLLNNDRVVTYSDRRVERTALVLKHNKIFPERPIRTIESYNDTMQSLQLPVHADRPIINTDRPFEQSAGKRPSQPAIVIAPGAAHAPKQFGLSRFAAIAGHLQNEINAHIIWAATSSENLDHVDSKLNRDKLTELTDHPLTDLADIIARSDLTIANDSGIAHLSSSVGTPTTALFGPTHPALGFAPAGLFDRVIEVEEFCRPCSLHGSKPCYREKQFCFTRIADSDVVLTAIETITKRSARQPALFVDRDGTLIKEKHFLKDPAQVEFESGAIDTLRAARDKGYRLVVLSNQSGVARGKMTIEQVESVNARVLELLAAKQIEIDGVYFCPYHREGAVAAYKEVHRDRKPSPGMVETAAAQLNIDMRKSIVVGDKRSDLHLAAVVGARGILVRTGYGHESETKLGDWERTRFAVCNTLGDASKLI